MEKKPERVIELCRNEINNIDKEILGLVKKRQQLSVKISRAKRNLRIPDRDFVREKAVFDQAQKLAKELDLPESFAINLQKLILESSLSQQEEDRIKHSFDHEQKSVLIIGGAGRLGKWLCRFFSDSGHTISVIDKIDPGFSCNFSTTLDKTANQHDIIVVATPIRASIDVLEQLYMLNIKKPYIFDVSSVKAPVYESLKKLKSAGVFVTSLHPMFGPSVGLLFGKHIIRTSLGVLQADQLANELFQNTPLTVVDMSIDEHDKTIAILLSLTHALNIIFVHALKDSSIPIKKLAQFSSPTFENLLLIAQKVFSENPHLYFEIQALNPYTKTAHELIKNSLPRLLNAVSQFNEEDFVAMMNEGNHYLSSLS